MVFFLLVPWTFLTSTTTPSAFLVPWSFLTATTPSTVEDGRYHGRRWSAGRLMSLSDLLQRYNLLYYHYHAIMIVSCDATGYVLSLIEGALNFPLMCCRCQGFCPILDWLPSAFGSNVREFVSDFPHEIDMPSLLTFGFHHICNGLSAHSCDISLLLQRRADQTRTHTAQSVPFKFSSSSYCFFFLFRWRSA